MHDDRRGEAARVHLRVGGGTQRSRTTARAPRGASPRGRRNHHRSRRVRRRPRCISAWAEEPARRRRESSSRWVHLRVGGGTSTAATSSLRHSGASPRGRRNLEREHLDERNQGCISAWAEEPAARAHYAAPRMVHLRVGGGTVVLLIIAEPARGASPRGRRNPHPPRTRPSGAGCISAWAEEPNPVTLKAYAHRVHLRVGGGTVRIAPIRIGPFGASPRGRRNPTTRRSRSTSPRCISAWAEEPRP